MESYLDILLYIILGVLLVKLIIQYTGNYIQVFGYKKELVSKIKTLCTESKVDFWLKVSGDIFNLDEDVIFGIVYVPPENTRYTSSTAFTEIEAEYLVLSRNYNYLSLL